MESYGVIKSYSMETGHLAQLIHTDWAPFLINPISQHVIHCLFCRGSSCAHLDASQMVSTVQPHSLFSGNAVQYRHLPFSE